MKTMLQTVVIVLAFCTTAMAQPSAVEVQKATGDLPKVTLIGSARTKPYNPHRRYHLVPEKSPTLGAKITLSVGSVALAGALVVGALVEPLNIGESQIETAIAIGALGFVTSVVSGLIWIVRALRNTRRAKAVTIGVLSTRRSQMTPRRHPIKRRSNAGAITGLVLSTLAMTFSTLPVLAVSGGSSLTPRERRIGFAGLGGMLLGTIGLVVAGIRLRRNRLHNRQVKEYAFLSPTGFGLRF